MTARWGQGSPYEKAARFVLSAIVCGLAMGPLSMARASEAASGEDRPAADAASADAASTDAAKTDADASEAVATEAARKERKAAPRRDTRPARVALHRGVFASMSLSIGHPNDGSQLRAKRLRPSPHLAILDKSRGRTFGHPSLVLMLQRSARQVAKSFPGSKLVVGDLSHEKGGPLSGHHSHQSGRDADVAFYARDARGRPIVLDRYVAFDADGRAKDGSGLVFDDERNYRLIETWVRDARASLTYVFVSRPLKARLVAWGNKHAKNRELFERIAPLFLQPENAEPHDDHFHVRVRCPAKQESICHEGAK
jgi:penicillin-insensitive murein endopeptidase